LNTTMRSIPLSSTDSITQAPSAAPAASDLPIATARSHASAPGPARASKFLSFYKPYIGLFLMDMGCALIVSATLLALPLCAQYVTTHLLDGAAPHALTQIALMGALMLALV